jgi:acetyltransferase-like isoleucine patch superfamily enzyme
MLLRNVKESMGLSPNIKFPISTLGLSAISIGDNFNVRKNFKLRAYHQFGKDNLNPNISIAVGMPAKFIKKIN